MNDGTPAHFDRPVFLLGSPRSGSTLLLHTMAQAPGAFTIGGESHALIETIPGLHPFDRGWSSNRLEAADATSAVTRELRRRFAASLRDRDGAAARGPVRMIEKTPKNSLRIPFLDAIFPDALYAYLYRDVRQTLSSMIEAWSSGLFRTYPRLPDWTIPAWSLLLVPGWQQLRGLPLAEIVAHQWATVTTTMLDDLDRLPRSRRIALAYDRLLAEPRATMEWLSGAVGLGWDRALEGELPLSATTVTAPAAEKWRRHENEIRAIWPIVEPVNARALSWLEVHRVTP
ncbi:sulfotransferase family protein [Sphingomonas oryzagri]